MYVDKNSLIINNINMGQYLTNVKFGYHDTWSSDSGYALSKKFKGSLEGTYPKFTLTFRPLTNEEVQYLTINIFRTVIQTLTYIDPVDGEKTIETHKGDLELDYARLGKAQAFNYSLVANEPI